MTSLLEVTDLTVAYRDGTTALRDVSLSLGPGRAVGIIGESGSGKSTMVNAVLGMLRGGRVTGGSIHFDGQDLLALDGGAMQRLRGRRISVIPQAALGALNPVLRVGSQLTELIRLYQGVGSAAAEGQAVDLLTTMGLPQSGRILRSYPHQLSGGQRQRILIAMALAGSPSLVLADEPTTALDVMVQARIIALLRRLRKQQGFSLAFVTHQLSLLPGLVDDVLVLRRGRTEEYGPLADVLARPQSDYTRMLLAKVPRLELPV